jgi:hypothetical protein
MAKYFFLCLSFPCDLPDIPAFYPSLNTRDNLRATLDRQEIVLGTIPRFTVPDTPGTRSMQVPPELGSNTAFSKILPSVQVSPYGYMSFSGSTT